jgi:hypothetical protein
MATGLVLLSQVSAALATPLDSSAFTYKYEGDEYNPITGYTENTSWGTTPSLLTLVPNTDDGNVISFVGDIPSGGGFFYSTQWPGHPINDSTGWTLEFRVQIGTDASEATLGAFGVGVNDGSSNAGQAFGVGQNQFGSFAGVFDTSDNTDDFHVFRLAQNAASGTTDAWRDGVYVGSYAGNQYNFGTPEMYWGDGSGDIGGPTVLVDYVRFTPGYFEPVPEPASASLFILGMAGVFRFVVRRRRS